MYSNKDKLYLQTNDMPILKKKLERAETLSKELQAVLNDIDNYDLEFEIKKSMLGDTKNTLPAHTCENNPPDFKAIL